LQNISKGALDGLFALWPLQPIDGESYFRPWQIVTYSFMHGNTTHLLFNMLGLWMFGSEVEFNVGPGRLLACYFASVVTAALSQLFVPMLFGAPPGRPSAHRAESSAFCWPMPCCFRSARWFRSFRHSHAGVAVCSSVCRRRTLSRSDRNPVRNRAFRPSGGMVGSALVIAQWRYARGRR